MNEELKVIISAEISKFKQGVADAKKHMDDFTKDSDKGASKMDDAFRKIGTAAQSGLKVAAGAMAGVSAALVALGPATAEYRAAQAKLVSAFETVGSSAETAKDTYNDLYRVLGDSDVAVEAAGHLAKLTTEEKALSEWTTICQGVYATFGDSLPIEGLTEAANETAKVGTLTGSLADALNWAGVNEEDFQAKLDACVNEQEREALIRETLNGLYTDAAAKYEENAAAVIAQNEANARMQSNMAALGEVMAPVITAFTNFGNTLLETIIPTIQSLAEQYGPQLNEALSAAAEFVGTMMSAIAENWEIIVGIAAVIGGIATAIGLYNVVAAVKAAMDAAQVATLGALVAAYAAQAAAMAIAIAPYLLIVAAIAGVIAVIVLCVKHWDEIKAKVVEVSKAIWEKVKEMADKVVKFFEDMKAKVQEKMNAVKEVASTIFGAITDNIKSKIELAKTIIQNVLGIIKGIFTGDFGAVKESVINIFSAVYNTIKSKIESAKNIVKSVIEAIKGFFNFKITWPKIPMPHFSLSPSGWKIGDLLKGTIPKLSISWYAKGGVFDDPTLFSYGSGQMGGLGENGAEAIVPLEKNTEWLTKIAHMLGEQMGGNRPVVLQVDGKTFAETSFNTMNDYIRQTGTMPLRIV